MESKGVTVDAGGIRRFTHDGVLRQAVSLPAAASTPSTAPLPRKVLYPALAGVFLSVALAIWAQTLLGQPRLAERFAPAFVKSLAEDVRAVLVGGVVLLLAAFLFARSTSWLVPAGLGRLTIARPHVRWYDWALAPGMAGVMLLIYLAVEFWNTRYQPHFAWLFLTHRIFLASGVSMVINQS